MVLFLLLLPRDVLGSAGALQLLLAVSKVGALWLFGVFFVLFCCKSSALSHCEYQKSCSLCSWESSTPNARFFCFEDLSLVCVLCRFLCCPS